VSPAALHIFYLGIEVVVGVGVRRKEDGGADGLQLGLDADLLPGRPLAMSCSFGRTDLIVV
jgi:hypothetical protein